MKIALDTNVLAYAAGVDDAARQERARFVMSSLADQELVLPQQVAGELFDVLRRKAGFESGAAAAMVGDWIDLLGLAPCSPHDFREALVLAGRHHLQIWDAVILATCAAAGCGLLLSEDMQDGFVYRGVTVADPFAERPHPLLASLLEPLTGASE